MSGGGVGWSVGPDKVVTADKIVTVDKVEPVIE